MTKALSTVHQTLRVFEHNGELCTTSRVVAEDFFKDHGKVLRDIRALSCSPEFRAANFGFTFENKMIGVTNRDDPTVVMTRDGFLFLAMGYRGEKAGKVLEGLLMRFRELEAEVKALRARSTALDLDDPAQFLQLSASLLAKTQELRVRAETAEAQVVAAQPAVDFARRVRSSQRTFCLTDACKILQVKPKAGIEAMAAAGLIYRRTSGGAWAASNPYLDRLWLKASIYETESFMSTQVRVTCEGLYGIASKIDSSLTKLEIHNRLAALDRQPDLLVTCPH